MLGDSVQLGTRYADRDNRPTQCLSQNAGRWTSDAPAVVSVTPSGLARALRVGTARLTATDGRQAVVVRFTVTER